MERFGEAIVRPLADATSRSLPFLGSRAFRRRLWRIARFVVARVSAASLAEATPSIPADVATAPPDQPRQYGCRVHDSRLRACAQCQQRDHLLGDDAGCVPVLRAVGVGRRRRPRSSRRGIMGSTVGVSTTPIVFDQQEVHRNVALHSDSIRARPASGDVRPSRMTRRLQDPDLSPDGRPSWPFARTRGTPRAGRGPAWRARLTDFKRLDAASVTTLVADPDTQFSAPRWSPDGRLDRRRAATPRCPARGRRARCGRPGTFRLCSPTMRARIVTPAWRPDGRAVIAAADFDGGPFDLYEFALDDSGTARRLTRTSGALWPDVSARWADDDLCGLHGRWVRRLHHSLCDRGIARYRNGESRSIVTAVSAVPAEAVAPPVTGQARRTSLFSSRNCGAYLVDSATSARPMNRRASVPASRGPMCSGGMPGRRTSRWLVNGPAVVRPVADSVPDWNAAYAYTRHQPSFFGSASRETTFGTAVFGASARPHLRVAVVEHELQAGAFLPIVHVRRNAQAAASLVRTERRYRLPDGDRTTTLVSSRLAFAHDSTQQYGYSVSREHGANVGGTIELAREALGSDGRCHDQRRSMRARTFPGSACTMSSRCARQPGCRAGSTGCASRRSGSAKSRPRRASSTSAATRSDCCAASSGTTPAGTRVLVANVEYRLPLAVLERGHGTWPLFLRTAHAAFFADTGQVRRRTITRTPAGSGPSAVN